MSLKAFPFFNACLLALLVSSGFSASFLGANALGLEWSPLRNAFVREGFSYANPAGLGFEQRMQFKATIAYGYTLRSGDAGTLGLPGTSVPNLSMGLPLGSFGALGFGMLQRYGVSNRVLFLDSALHADALVECRSSLFELAPAYSYRFPGFLRGLSLGVQYRLFFGNGLYETRRGPASADDGNSWFTSDVTVGQRTDATWSVESEWFRNFRGGLHWHGRSIDYFVSYAPGLTLGRDLRTKTQFSNTDTLATTESAQRVDYPALFATGLRLRFTQRHSLGLEYEQQGFEGTMRTMDGKGARLQNANRASLVYQWEGSSLYYDPFWKRNSFRLSGWFKSLYLKDCYESGASLGTGLYLGRRGTKIDLDLLGGLRTGVRASDDEMFLGVELTLTGVGNWGQSSR